MSALQPVWQESSHSVYFYCSGAFELFILTSASLWCNPHLNIDRGWIFIWILATVSSHVLPFWNFITLPDGNPFLKQVRQANQLECSVQVLYHKMNAWNIAKQNVFLPVCTIACGKWSCHLHVHFLGLQYCTYVRQSWRALIWNILFKKRSWY